MARQVNTDAEATVQMWNRLTDTRYGMLWLTDSTQHPQPMTHFVDKDAGALWFITSSDTDLARELGHGAEARFTYASDKGDYQASLIGSLIEVQNREKLDELWSMPVSAWFEQGREDPKVTLLRFTPREAGIWASDANAILVGLKMMRAAMSDGEVELDVGTHRVFRLNDAA